MNNHRTTSHLRHSRRLGLIVLLVAILGLTFGGVAMATSEYASALKSARSTMAQPATADHAAPAPWQPPGCIFPAASAFARR